MNIAIVGLGYVGAVSGACFAQLGHSVFGVDRDGFKVDRIREGKAPFYEPGLEELVSENVAAGRLRVTTSLREALAEADVAIVCVGTPSDRSGNLGLEQMRRVCAEIGDAARDMGRPIVVAIRRTVFPGTCREVILPAIGEAPNVSLVANPEFLREGVAVKDFLDPALVVVGGDDPAAVAKVASLYASLPGETALVRLETAEMIKYACNAFHALKISFANEIGALCGKVNVPAAEVMSTLCKDTRLNTSAAYLKPGFAFGGSCLPKDVRALRAFAATNRTETPLLDAVLVANAEQIARAEAMVRDAGARRVGLIGISFKPGTDDMRESPLAELASRLIGQGVAVKVWDPYVQEACDHDLTSTGRGNDWGIDLKETLVPSLDDLIEGTDILLVGNRYEDAVTRLSALNGDRTVIDLARIDPKRRSGGSYHGICW